MPTHDLILGTAGHIDHGKTALIRALTGVDTDRLPEEKKRGITVDIGFANIELDDLQIGVVDVPGHERFIRNMLAGAAGIDLALLVVAADDSVMPQTREHLAILKLLGVQHGLIALTKCDLPDPGWVDLVEDEVRELVRGSFLESASIVRTSARAGTGIDQLRSEIARISRHATDRDDELPFRLAIDRSFVLKGVGTVVTGTVWSGSVGVGDEVDWLPVERKVRIRGIQSHGRAVQAAHAGQRAAIHLASVHHTEISRGHELAAPGYLRPARRLTVRLSLLPECPRPLKNRSRIRLHLGTGEVMSTIALLDSNGIEPGGETLAQLHCASHVCAVNGQAFVIRAESPVMTLGGGVVLQPVAPRIRRKESGRIARLPDLTDSDDDRRIAQCVCLLDTTPWTPFDLVREAGLPHSAVDRSILNLHDQGMLIRLDDSHTLHRNVVERLEESVLDRVRALHEETPLEPHVSYDRLASRMAYLDESLLSGIVDRLRADRRLNGTGNDLMHADFKPELSDRQIQAASEIVRMFIDSEFTPPDHRALAEHIGLKQSDIKPVIQLCVARGELVHVAGEIFLHRQHYRTLLAKVIEVIEQNGPLTVSRLREALGTTRKYAVPFCEHLDRLGFTKRRGDERILSNRAASILHECRESRPTSC